MTTESVLPRLLTVLDLDRAVEIQSHAFQSDPLWIYLVPDATGRKRILPHFFKALLTYSIRNHQTYGISDPLQGIAVWSDPVQKRKTSALIGAGPGFLQLIFSPYMAQFIRVRQIFNNFDRMQKKYAPEPHYYLNTISVAPDMQGKGLASKLIRPFLQRADASGVSVYTETVCPGNVGLYEHYGFRVMEEYRVPKTDLSIWSLYRPAKKASTGYVE